VCKRNEETRRLASSDDGVWFYFSSNLQKTLTGPRFRANIGMGRANYRTLVGKVWPRINEFVMLAKWGKKRR